MKKRFCKKCGSALKEESFLKGYDEYTGAKIIQVFGICPQSMEAPGFHTCELIYEKKDTL